MLDWTNAYDLSLLVTFTLCLSLTAGGILATFRADHAANVSAARSLQYFLVFLYVFGYYTLWSNLLIPQFLTETRSFLPVIPYMGIPFFAICLIMQLMWANQTRIRPVRATLPAALVVCAVSVLVLAQIGLQAPRDTVRGAYCLCGVVVAMTAIGLLSGKSALLADNRKREIIGVTLLIGLLYASYFTQLAPNGYYETIFVFLFFLLNTTFALLFTYAAKASQGTQAFPEFASTYGITTREADVIHGIYAGKTNQEIADQLFITLQTVKDHSSRIYQKTNVKNRTQLAALLRRSQSKDRGSNR